MKFYVAQTLFNFLMKIYVAKTKYIKSEYNMIWNNEMEMKIRERKRRVYIFLKSVRNETKKER